MFGLFTLLTLLVALPVQLIVSPWDPWRVTTAAIARRLWGTWMLRAQPLWRVHITGIERLRGGPWVIVPNHQTWLDIPLVQSLPIPVRLVAKPYVFRLPVFGLMARFGRHVSLDVEDPAGAERALTECRAWLARGVSVVIFPEGNRSPDGAIHPFRRGAFELALRAGVPVLPVVLRGAWEVQPRGRPVPLQPIVPIRVGVLEPVNVEGQSRRALARVAEARVRAAFDGPQPWELRAQAAALYRTQGRFREGWARGKTHWDPIFWMLHERLPATGTLLDVGCGEGLLAAYLSGRGQPGLRVLGFDLDEARIAVARAANIPDARFEVADAAELDVLPEADAITVIDVLHYLPPALQDRLIQRLCLALRPGGRLFVRDPERGAGWRSRFTAGSESALVAAGRHRGRGVWARGSEELAGVMRQHLGDVRIEFAGTGPFANVLITGAWLI